jgi:hypothetical protein
MNIIEAAADPHLFARWFRDRETWQAWFVFLRALFGLPMSENDRALYERCTDRSDTPAAKHGSSSAAAAASRWSSPSSPYSSPLS